MRVVGFVAIAGAMAACGFSGRAASVDGDHGGDDGDDADPGAPDAEAEADADPGFDPSQCPGTYDLQISSAAGSRFRFIDEAMAFSAHHADCNDDHPGWTHLVWLESVAEADEVAGLVSENDYAYVGAAQDPEATTPGTGWYTFGGTALPAIPWGFQQPDDGGGLPAPMENGEDQLLMLKQEAEVYDVPGTSQRFAVCECDGHALDADIVAWIPASP